MDGNLIRRLTEGVFPVIRVITVDEQAGWVYFLAFADRQRSLDRHLYRVNLEGNNFTQLTEATGWHASQFSPSKEFFLDTHSSVARPPVVELRRADGELLQTLSEANIDELTEELKWSSPEEFVVKAADNTTDIYGVLYKPYDFDPNKKYPVIELIYANPRSISVRNTFKPSFVWVDHVQALAQLGFITFIVDQRGTGGRGKEFRDVVYGNHGRYEIPDHVAALEQLAAERPYMDLSRVGIFGTSGGGYATLRAMLLAPDVYHVGIAAKARVQASAESYMDLPRNNQEGWEYSSNLRIAGNLKGKLLLIHGTSDINVPIGGTMMMVEALIQAGKPYDLLVFPEQPHASSKWGTVSTRYMREAIRRYFQEHLKP